MALLRELVERYGSLNHKILAHDIEAEWKDLRKWQKREDVEHAFDALRERIKKHL